MRVAVRPFKRASALLDRAEDRSSQLFGSPLAYNVGVCLVFAGFGAFFAKPSCEVVPECAVRVLCEPGRGVGKIFTVGATL